MRAWRGGKWQSHIEAVEEKTFSIMRNSSTWKSPHLLTCIWFSLPLFKKYAYLFITEIGFLEPGVFKKSHWGACVRSRESVSLSGGSDFQLKSICGLFICNSHIKKKKGNKFTSKLISLSSLLLYSKNRLWNAAWKGLGAFTFAQDKCQKCQVLA